MSIVDNLSLSQFDRVVWGQHNDGKSVSQIAKSIGADKQTVHDTIVDIWRMDKEFVRKSAVFAKAKEFNNKIDEQQECDGLVIIGKPSSFSIVKRGGEHGH